jgi:hypothetical protein
VSAPALAVSFFDADRSLYGTARAGATILFEGRRPTVLGEGLEIRGENGGWRAELPGHLALSLEPLCVPLDLGGMRAQMCRVEGEAEGRRVQCLGTLAETESAPRWEELDALRTISALVDEGQGLLALARRPRGVAGHGEEIISAWLVQEGEALEIEDARLSTVYDANGRQRSAGMELWLPGEEFPRRGSGTAIAGSSLDLEAVQVHAAVFRWRLGGRDGIGAYELMVRREQPAAA